MKISFAEVAAGSKATILFCSFFPSKREFKTNNETIAGATIVVAYCRWGEGLIAFLFIMQFSIQFVCDFLVDSIKFIFHTIFELCKIFYQKICKTGMLNFNGVGIMCENEWIRFTFFQMKKCKEGKKYFRFYLLYGLYRHHVLTYPLIVFKNSTYTRICYFRRKQLLTNHSMISYHSGFSRKTRNMNLCAKSLRLI